MIWALRVVAVLGVAVCVGIFVFLTWMVCALIADDVSARRNRSRRQRVLEDRMLREQHDR